MKAVQLILMCMMLANVIACDSIPYHNTDHKPLLIEADGKNFITCGAYSMRDASIFGEPSYELSFKDAAQGGADVSLKGVRKLTITELPAMEDAPMPSTLPDSKNGVDSGGKPYQEGSEYSWIDGSKAKLQDGEWKAVKVPNTVCNTK